MVRARLLALTLLATGSVAILAGCGPVVAPSLRQASGAVDEPCPGATAGGAKVAACTARAVILNTGGRGSGVTTLTIALKNADGSTGQPAFCVTAIPVVAHGDYVEISCRFSLREGSSVATPPMLTNTAVSAQTNDGSDLSTVVAALAAATALMALATLQMARHIRRAARPAG